MSIFDLSKIFYFFSCIFFYTSLQFIIYEEINLNFTGDSSHYATKIYFIDPVDYLSPVIDKLIRFEYETYTVGLEDKDNLHKILDPNILNIIFISIKNVGDIEYWFNHLDTINKTRTSNIKIGAFAYSNINFDHRKEFKARNVELFLFSDIQKSVVYLCMRIVNIFGATNRRKHIRAKARGRCSAYIDEKTKKSTLTAEIVDISSNSFSCKFTENKKPQLKQVFYNNIFLSLRGIQIQVSANLIGYRDKKDGRYFLFKICGDGRGYQAERKPVIKVPSYITKRIFRFINTILIEDIRLQLDSI